MPVYWVHTSARKESGGHHGFLFEVKAASVAELAEVLKRDGIVAGHKLYTTDDGRGGRLVKERIATAITVEGLASVSELREMSADLKMPRKSKKRSDKNSISLEV